MVSKNSDESKEAVANLITELRELKLTSFELDTAIKMLKSDEAREIINLIYKPLDINTILSNYNNN